MSIDQCGQTSCHKSAVKRHVEILEKLLVCAKVDKLNSDCLKFALFLPEDCRSFNAWCHALNNGNIDVLEKLWGWAEDLPTTNEFNKLLLAVDRGGYIAIYWAYSITGENMVCVHGNTTKPR
jgi:hypothetical protein